MSRFGVSMPFFDLFWNACTPEAFERLCLKMPAAALGLEDREAHDLLDRLGKPPQVLKRRGDPDDVPRDTDRHGRSIPYMGYTRQVLMPDEESTTTRAL
jgi:hypothetical protein